MLLDLSIESHQEEAQNHGGLVHRQQMAFEATEETQAPLEILPEVKGEKILTSPSIRAFCWLNPTGV